MQSNRKNSISILCVAGTETDPAANLTILSAIKKFRDKNITTIYCTDEPEFLETSLESFYKKVEYKIDRYENHIKDFDLNKYFWDEKNQAFPFFDEENRSHFENDFIKCMKTTTSIKDDDLIRGLCNRHYITLPAIYACKDLLNYLIKNEIKLFTIGLKKSLEDYIRRTTSSIREISTEKSKKNTFSSIVNNTIATLVNQIYHNAIQPLQSSGGVIICKVDYFTAHRLAVSLYDKYKIPSMAIYSYSDQSLKYFDEEISIASRFITDIDSDEVIKLYKKIPCVKLHYEFDNKNEALNNLLDEIITSNINAKPFINQQSLDNVKVTENTQSENEIKPENNDQLNDNIAHQENTHDNKNSSKQTNSNRTLVCKYSSVLAIVGFFCINSLLQTVAQPDINPYLNKSC